TGAHRGQVPVESGLDRSLGATELPHRPRREADEHGPQPPFHRQRADDDGLAQRLAAQHHWSVVSRSAAVRCAEGEFAATQTAPHFAEAGQSAQSMRERLVVGGVGHMAAAGARTQLPAVDAVTSWHGGRSFGRSQSGRRRCRQPAHTLPATAPDPGVSDVKAPGVLPVRPYWSTRMAKEFRKALRRKTRIQQPQRNWLKYEGI